MKMAKTIDLERKRSNKREPENISGAGYLYDEKVWHKEAEKGRQMKKKKLKQASAHENGVGGNDSIAEPRKRKKRKAETVQPTCFEESFEEKSSSRTQPFDDKCLGRLHNEDINLCLGKDEDNESKKTPKWLKLDSCETHDASIEEEEMEFLFYGNSGENVTKSGPKREKKKKKKKKKKKGKQIEKGKTNERIAVRKSQELETFCRADQGNISNTDLQCDKDCIKKKDKIKKCKKKKEERGLQELETEQESSFTEGNSSGHLTEKDISKKSKKKKKIKKEKGQEDLEEKTKQTIHPALDYLLTWYNNRKNWNFKKVRQVWLLHNMFDQEKIPNENFSILLEYLEGLKGAAKAKTIEMAEQKLENATGTAKQQAVIESRVRQVLQMLSE